MKLFLPERFANDRPTKMVRGALAVLALGFIAIFVIATQLSPDKRHFGTHQQLGLPPCTFLQLTGVKCPHCGMTTSFSHLVRGQLGGAWTANPGGFPLSVMMLLAIPAFLVISITGRWIITYDPLRWMMFGGMGYVVFVIMWWAGDQMVS